MLSPEKEGKNRLLSEGKNATCVRKGKKCAEEEGGEGERLIRGRRWEAPRALIREKGGRRPVG